MKQFQYEFKDYMGLKRFLSRIMEEQNALDGRETLFHIYSEILDKTKLEKIIDTIQTDLPDAKIAGASTNGNICNGKLSEYAISISCTLFEEEDTKVMIHQMELSEESIKLVYQQVKEILSENPWIKMAEILTTMRGINMNYFCEEFNELKEDIAIFGGGAFSDDINVNEAFVLSSQEEPSDHGIVFVFVGGENFHVMTSHVTGWKSLGKSMKVTHSSGNTLYTLDDIPAYDVYYKYLNIENNASFFQNTLEFPFLYPCHGVSLLRAPVSANKDASIVMTAGIEEGTMVQLSYGDPQVILRDVQIEAEKIQAFQPQAIVLHSCAARKFYWNGKANQETGPFQRLAPTSGFYTSGEFLRTGKFMNQHNVTLVISAMREGDIEENEFSPFHMKEVPLDGTVSMVSRMAHFIDATTTDLLSTNRQLTLSNMMDGLTQILNRREIQRRVEYACQYVYDHPAEHSTVSCIMIDVDDFKRVNDQYGHNEGDLVLITLANLLKNLAKENLEHLPFKKQILEDIKIIEKSEQFHPFDAELIENTVHGIASVGRWGGEEFLILLPKIPLKEAAKFAEIIREEFSNICFEKSGKHTISLGVSNYVAGQQPDVFVDHADQALYLAKRNGKNQVVVK